VAKTAWSKNFVTRLTLTHDLFPVSNLLARINLPSNLIRIELEYSLGVRKRQEASDGQIEIVIRFKCQKLYHPVLISNRHRFLTFNRWDSIVILFGI